MDKHNKTSSHGGKREGAGRKMGSGKFGEQTKVMRVPQSKVAMIKTWLEKAVNQQEVIELPQFSNAQAFRPDFSTQYEMGLYSHKVVAGFPSPADDNLEQAIDLNTYFIRKPETTFLVKVQGDSMKKAGIYPGDLLAVDRSAEPKDGKIVIAAIDGEMTVKRLSVKSTGTWLMPENDHYDPIPVREGSELVIWGVVVSVLRLV